MAFHVACPITCRRICDCELGFPEGLQSGSARGEFLEEIAALEEFLKDPWTLRIGGEESTVQTLVPRVVPPPLAADEDGEEAASAQAKRAALQRQAVAASLAAEDYVRRLEAGGAAADLLGEAASTLAREDQGSSTMNVICRICFSGENEGRDRAIKMLSCKICNKKYHRSCLKSWAEYRDLFHWSSWACPSCRICEVCRRAGDPNKLMYCKRCDGACHCYCQQPPHKNVGHGPYLCPKHTRCHSCGSTVPGSGLSTRWFLGYTCCDACGRLFVKGNYCPVCLKVYRESETTPMVCCDVCERWVHCVCDGISDEKYQQYQADQNLQYKCAACRGECYQVKDIDDAVRELWRRRDEAERELIASLRVGAGLPSQEEIFSLSPYSDDEQSGPVILKNDYGRSLKFSVKGFSDKSTKNSKECGKTISKNFFPNKKYTKKKGYRIKFVGKPEGLYQNFERQNEERSLDSTFRDPKPDDMNSYRTDGPESPLSFMTRSPDNDGMKSCDNQLQSNKYISVKEVGLNNVDRVSKVQSEGSKLHGVHFEECAVKNASKNETFKGTKLVIHLGSRNRNVSSSPRSETSSCHREQDLAASYGSDDISQPKTKDSKNHMHEAHGGTVRCDGKGAKLDNTNQMRSSKHGDREKKFIKLGKISDMQRNSNGNISEECEQLTKCTPSRIAVETVGEVTLRNAGEVVVPNKKQSVGAAAINLQNDGSHHTSRLQFVSSAASNDPKPLLKLKFKNPYFEQQSSWASRGEEENPVKGQRSKRKRPATTEKAGAGVEEDDSYAAQMHHQENTIIDQVMDANWILQKLGKDAIGKRVEVQQLSDNSWHEGVVSNVTTQGRGTSSSSLSVHLDDGRCMTVELGKQGVRFVSQNSKKRAKI